MARTTFRRKDILKAMTEIFGSVSSNVFVNTRPSATDDAMKDFIVVSLPNGMRDYHAYQDAYCTIEVFARNRKGGIEATDVLDTMQQAVTDKLPVSNELFSITEPRLLPGGDDRMGFHCLIIQAKMIIK